MVKIIMTNHIKKFIFFEKIIKFRFFFLKNDEFFLLLFLQFNIFVFFFF